MVIVCEASVSICVRPWRCVCPLCRAPALSVCGRGGLCVGARRSLRRGPALSTSGPGALCVALARRSLCRAPALSVSGPGALCVGAWHFPRSLCRALLCRALCVGARRSLCPGPALSVGVGVGARRALYVGARQSVRRGPTIFVSGPGALCVGDRPALFVSGPDGCLCRGPACRPSGPRPPARSARHHPAPMGVHFSRRTPNLTAWGTNTKQQHAA